MSCNSPMQTAPLPLDAWMPLARQYARTLLGGKEECALLDVRQVFRIFPPERASGEAAFRLAEALPRIPDQANRTAMLRDQIPFLRTWGTAMFAERVAAFAIHSMSGRFVFAPDISAALVRAARDGGYYSFDMLGEAARTSADAKRNFAHYIEAIVAIARAHDAQERYGISVKLSSIHERYDAAGFAGARPLLIKRLRELCRGAAAAGIGLTLDAEESWRLPMHLELFEALATDTDFSEWPGLGIAVQAYLTGVNETIERLIALRTQRAAPICIRLVKGAYWDAEVKRAQELGLTAYPVHTDKRVTDLAYVTSARRLLEAGSAIWPQFASHNPITIASLLALAGDRPLETQRLHGMGGLLGRRLSRITATAAVRVYAPVGPRSDLLAYLIRRLLENGASTSYVRQAAQIRDRETLLANGFRFLQVPRIEGLILPTELQMPERRVAKGVDVAEPTVLARLAKAVASRCGPWIAVPLLSGRRITGVRQEVFSPADPERIIGHSVSATRESVREAAALAQAAHATWAETPVVERTAVLDRLADRLEQNMTELVTLCVLEAGKTIGDSVADVREAVDFCRYYAHQARVSFGEPTTLRSPSGETNELSLHGRGVFACISPWNFPVAIFTGQITAALVAGNTVLAKPAEQTPLCAFRVAQLLLDSGIPPDVFHLLTGDGAIGGAIVEQSGIAGVAFTGASATARAIQNRLAARDGPLVPLIAETGGLNAMIVDSTALPEQVVDAVVASAFQSAGQRCSSLRMLYLQEEIAPRVIELLQGAIAALRVGDPADATTDVGPVIDAAACRTLRAYVDELRGHARLLAEGGPLPVHGHYIAPIAFEVNSIRELPGERFGPILHVARFELKDLDRVIDEINATGYGLTMGVHSRMDSRVAHIRRRARVGNLYVNRNIIGAVVGVQPFGGEGLSGTGPKAGGPRYLARFATERTVTVNTAAIGGDLRLLTRNA